MLNRERTVHALTSEGLEVVRYDTGGKWFVEDPSGKRPQRNVSIYEAAELAASGMAPLGLYGGNLFDAQVRKRAATRQ